jgi:hypothetical protein
MLAITHLHLVLFANFRASKYSSMEMFANIRACKCLPKFTHGNVCQYSRMLPILAHASVAIFRTRKCLPIFAHVANYSHTQMFANIRKRKCLPIFAHVANIRKRK